MARLEGKVVFITGVARGQGRAHAIRFAEEGADIIGVDICRDIATAQYPMATLDDMQETQALIEQRGRRALLTQADVRDPAALKAAVDAGVAELGGLHGVVAQAGLSPLGTKEVAAFLDAANIMLGGIMNAVTAAMPHLSAGSSIVCTGSLAALMTGATDNPELGAGGLGYSWAKRSVATYVNDLALACAPEGIRVNAIHPTNVSTPMLHQESMYKIFRPDLEHPARADVEDAMKTMTALDVPYVEAEDVADMAAFLMSEEARHVTGMQMRVDAGGYVKVRPGAVPF